jgi:fluoroacetyl-CoA thioesterase
MTNQGGAMAELTPGLVGEATLVVEERHTARHLGSGGVNVLATPVMITLMEEAGRNAVEQKLAPGQLTVGAELHVKHLAPTPMGMRVTVRAELVAVDGRMLTFRVEAHDEKEKVGEGTHVRAIIDLDRFHARVQAKAG